MQRDRTRENVLDASLPSTANRMCAVAAAAALASELEAVNKCFARVATHSECTIFENVMRKLRCKDVAKAFI